ncbi:MAG: hypoxanthine phosphoribosyltransferase, partial [Clostridiales bacterium]|nr:hypoxanthine phosphoribosyltransferase [Clostridiales bacterium]
GLTLSYIISTLSQRGAASVRTATLLDKPERRKKALHVDYCCFTIPNEFVVGYGLDYDEKYRNMPDVGVLSPKVYSL